MKQLTQLEQTICLQVGHETQRLPPQAEPSNPPSLVVSEDTLLIEQCMYCNTCAMSAGESSSPHSIETSNTAAQATPG